MLLKASSFCLSASLGLAICSMEVMPASFIFLAVAGPTPLTLVRSDLSAGLAALAATGLALLAAGLFAAGLLVGAGLAAGLGLAGEAGVSGVVALPASVYAAVLACLLT